MSNDLYEDLRNRGIHSYGSDELKKFERQLTKYFSREYERYRDSDEQSVAIDQGPLAIESDRLADDHYNEGLTFFQNFLDQETMSYSMAYFDSSADGVIKSVKTLAQAQIDKFALIAKRMKLKGDEKLLNIGCGFGYFERYLLEKFPDLDITSITHSQDQYDFIMKHTKELDGSNSSERLKIYLGTLDRETVPVLGREKYDVVCSIGMMEHINNIKLFFEIINQLLVKNGRMFHHLIVSRDLIPQLLDSHNTLIGAYFPGGKVLPFAALNTDLAGFTIEESWFLCGLNYWKTLEKWHESYWHNMDRLYPRVMDSERVEHWNNYFVLCKAMFFPEHGSAYGNGQYLFIKN